MPEAIISGKDLGEAYRHAVIDNARSLSGVYWRPGQTCQCANFVRHVFNLSGIDLPIAAHPTDAKLLPPGEPIGASYADSFAGSEIGERIDTTAKLRGGDIVMFRNTYGNYPAGVITHVGVMVNEFHFVHRPTADRPVETAPIAGYWAGKFAEGRRPAVFGLREDTAKIYAHNGKANAYYNGKEFKAAVFKAFANGGRTAFFASFDGRSVDFSAGKCTIAVGCKDWKARLFRGADGSWKWFSPSGYVPDRKNVCISLLIGVHENGKARIEFDFGDGKGLQKHNDFSAEAVFIK